MPVALLDPTRDPRWDAFVESNPKATLFHHSSWARVIADTYGYPHRYYAVIEGNDIVAALPFFEIKSLLTGNRWVSIPFSDRAPILASSRNQLEEILEKVTDDFSKSGFSYIEIRSGEEPFLPPDRAGSPHLKNFTRVENHILNLATLSEDVEATYNKLDTKRARWAVRRSQRDGIVIEMDNSLDAMRSFYRMNVETRRKLGAPPQPWSLFSNIHRFIIEPDRGFILMARRGGATFGGLVLFKFRDTVTTKYSASDRRYLKYQFTHALFWEAMKWGCEHGYSIFDMGRTAAGNRGLISMKKHLGSESSPLAYYYYPEAKGVGTIREKSLSYRLMKIFFRRMPAALTRPIGSCIYRHLG